MIVIGVGWWLSAPQRVDQADFAQLSGDAARGKVVFDAGGCASCHAAPGATGEAKLILAGGHAFPSEFGTFYAPNISPSAQGIQDWQVSDLANAMIKGVAPSGAHYYPAFPYGSYARTRPQDVADLKAYLDGLPPDATPNRPHEVPFPFNMRRGLGLWKRAFVSADPVFDVGQDPKLLRGQYLVETLGHCAQCHTSRNVAGGLRRGLWMGGAPNPDGRGRVPNITPHADGIGTWSSEEIADYLTTGFTPDYDVAGGSMADVVENLAKLPAADVAAIVAYLKAIPALAASAK